MATEDKFKTIEKAYYSETGFGSNAMLLKDAREIDPSITMDDVVAWKNKNIERKKKMRGYNSYVAPEPRYEYQIDLFYYNNPNADEDTPYGLLAIDSFTKYCWVVPLDKKDSIYWIYGLKVIFEKMGKPKVIYSDPDSSLQANLIKQFFEKENIKWI